MIVEESADKKVELEKAQFEQADQALKEYEGKVTEELKILAPGSPKRKKAFDERLLYSLQNKLKGHFEKEKAFSENGIASILAKKIVKKGFGFQGLLNSMEKDEEEREKWIQDRVIDPAMKEIMVPVFDTEMNEYVAELMNEESLLSRGIEDFVAKIQTSINAEWEAVKGKNRDSNLLGGIDFQSIPGGAFLRASNGPLNAGGIRSDIYDSSKTAFLRKGGVLGLGLLGGAGLGLLLAHLGVSLGLILWPLIPIIIPLGMVGVNMLGAKTIKKALSEKWDDIEKQIYDATRKEVVDSFICPLIDNIRVQLENRANGPRREFENRKREAEKRWVMAEEDRRKLAEQARDIRTRDVAPLREKIGDFIARAGVEYPAVS